MTTTAENDTVVFRIYCVALYCIEKSSRAYMRSRNHENKSFCSQDGPIPASPYFIFFYFVLGVGTGTAVDPMRVPAWRQAYLG